MIELQHAVGESLERREVVRDDDGRPRRSGAALRGANQLRDLPCRITVETRRRFIEHEDGRVACHRARDGQTLYVSSAYYTVRNPMRVYNDGSVLPQRDVDGDGNDDLTLRSNQGLWFFLKSTGSGFGVQYAGRWAAAGWSGIAQGDFNGDGRQDVIGITEAGHWWVGESNGTQFANLYRGHWEGTAGATLYVGDFNGDGKDQPLLNSPAHMYNWRTGAAHAVSGRFYMEGGRAGAFSLGTNWEFTIGDFDGSGTDDVVGYLYGHDIRFLDGMYFMSIDGRNMSDSLEFADTFSPVRLFATGCLPVA